MQAQGTWLPNYAGAMQIWGRRGGRVLYEGGPGGRVRLRVDEAVRPDGAEVAYPYVQVPDSVRVLAVHHGRAPLVRQHHYLHNTVIQDLPGGVVDQGETPLDAARRELREETGLTAASLHLLGLVVTSRSVSTEKVHLYLAQGDALGTAAPEAGEAIETTWCAWHDLAGRGGVGGELADAASLATVLRADGVLRQIGGELPAGGDLDAAAWAAYTTVQTRAPGSDDHLVLLWVDAAIGVYAEGARIVDQIQRISRTSGWEAAWHHAATELHELG